MSNSLNIKNELSIVLLDDNLAIRFALQNVLDSFSNEVNFKIYTASEGIEGLGYIYAVSPDIIVVDTTLPKYSGRELLDFLYSNNKLNRDKKFLVLHDGTKSIEGLPKDYVLLQKNDKYFLNKFRSSIQIFIKSSIPNLAEDSEPSNYSAISAKGITNFINSKLIRWGSISDFFMSKFTQPTGMNSIYLVPWVLSQVILSFLFALSSIYNHKHIDSNVDQKKADLKTYRVMVYPTLVTVLSTLFFLLFQFFLFVTGGLIVFGSVSFKSIFANEINHFQATQVSHVSKQSIGNFNKGVIEHLSGTYSKTLVLITQK